MAPLSLAASEPAVLPLTMHPPGGWGQEPRGDSNSTSTISSLGWREATATSRARPCDLKARISVITARYRPPVTPGQRCLQHTPLHRAEEWGAPAGNGWANSHNCSSQTLFPPGAPERRSAAPLTVWLTPAAQAAGPPDPAFSPAQPEGNKHTLLSAQTKRVWAPASTRLHRARPEPARPGGAVDSGRSRWWRNQNRLQRPRARPPTEGAVISVTCPPTLIRLRLRPSPLVTESLRMTSPRKWGRRGNTNARMRNQTCLPLETGLWLTAPQQTTRARQRNPAENEGGKNHPELFCLPSKLENATLRMIYAAIFSLYSQRICQASQEHRTAVIWFRNKEKAGDGWAHSLGLRRPQSQGPGRVRAWEPWAFTGDLAHQQSRPRGLCTVTPPGRDRGFQDHSLAGRSSFPAASTGEAGHPDPRSSKGLRAAPRGLGQPLRHRGVWACLAGPALIPWHSGQFVPSITVER